MTSRNPIPVRIVAGIEIEVLPKNREDKANNVPISPWCILLPKMYTLGDGDSLYLDFQYDKSSSAVANPNISPPLMPKLHNSP